MVTDQDKSDANFIKVVKFMSAVARDYNEDAYGNLLRCSFDSDFITGTMINDWLAPMIDYKKYLSSNILKSYFSQYLESDLYGIASIYNVKDIKAKATELADKISTFIVDDMLKYKIESKHGDALSYFHHYFTNLIPSPENKYSGMQAQYYLEGLLFYQGDPYQLLKEDIVTVYAPNYFRDLMNANPLIEKLNDIGVFNYRANIFEDKIKDAFMLKIDQYRDFDSNDGFDAGAKALVDFSMQPDYSSYVEDSLQQLLKIDSIQEFVSDIASLDIVRSTGNSNMYALTRNGIVELVVTVDDQGYFVKTESQSTWNLYKSSSGTDTLVASNNDGGVPVFDDVNHASNGSLEELIEDYNIVGNNDYMGCDENSCITSNDIFDNGLL